MSGMQKYPVRCRAPVGDGGFVFSTDPSGAVTVTGGLFNVEIGSGSVTDGSGPGTFSTLADVFGQHADLYLEVEVNGETLSPRTAAKGNCQTSEPVARGQRTAV